MAESDEADALYSLPLAEFTAARNALAARLRKAGDRSASDAVKGFAKPSITAWALNQVARRQPELVTALLDAADELRRAQQQLLAGHGQAGFREASQAERGATAVLVRAAAEVLEEDGHPANKTVLDRIEATARAAVADPEAAERLQAGHLTADLNPSGFGGLEGAFGLPAAPIPFPTKRAAPVPKTARPEPEPDQSALVRAREEVHRLQRELLQRRQEAGEAEGQAARARQAAAKADQDWAAAREAAARAEKAANLARRAEEGAAEDLTRARTLVDETADALERAEAEVKRLRS